MKINGRCYCGQVKFTFDGEPRTAVQCYCRECQYISGGNPNAAMVLPKGKIFFADKSASITPLQRFNSCFLFKNWQRR